MNTVAKIDDSRKAKKKALEKSYFRLEIALNMIYRVNKDQVDLDGEYPVDKEDLIDLFLEEGRRRVHQLNGLGDLK